MSSSHPETRHATQAIGLASEWLEADGLGGFASGTVSGVRTRRYHGWLHATTTPPDGRIMLVNGVEAWLETASGTVALSSHSYAPDVIHPDGRAGIESFEAEPWPRWTLRLDGGAKIVHEIFASYGSPIVAVSWKLVGGDEEAVLCVRPLISGRDPHALHHENPALRFDADVAGRVIGWRPYESVTGIVSASNGAYEHAPLWYRNFSYSEERDRGFDFIEDLASPGVLRFDVRAREAVLILAADTKAARNLFFTGSPESLHETLRANETQRRAQFETRLDRAADAYIVQRGTGKTIIAGYPWFGDWGRDTFIALRGLCLATGRLADARSILLQWAGRVSAGMLPNRFSDRDGDPEFNSVDAPLWYVVAVHDFLAACAARAFEVAQADRARLVAAIEAILAGYSRGTRYGIRMDADGLLASGAAGVQLTWMDAKVGDRVITPRIGKPVEIQALWLNALRIGSNHSAGWGERLPRVQRSFEARFWNPDQGCLRDVVDEQHVAGRDDATFRPNQIFAVGGLPYAAIEGERARAIVDAVEARLLTPVGVRSLAGDDARYVRRYEGGPQSRDNAYHQGTVWPWLIGPFVEAWVRVRGTTEAAKAEARERFLAPLLATLDQAGIGHVSEIADADAPHVMRGCPFQAWSLGEVLRLDRDVLKVERARMKAAGSGTPSVVRGSESASRGASARRRAAI
jgi:predicted glycogen debranching enzyme